MSTQIERSSATRSTILAVARAAFVRDGYDGTSLEKIALDAGCTKGALYHHYDSKRALFVAVFSLISLEIISIVGEQTNKTGTPRDQLKAAAMAWLDAVERSDGRTILLDLGPKALGFADARTLEDQIALHPLLALVDAVIETEELGGAVDAVLAARLINAALTEIALLRNASDRQAPTTEIAAQAMAGVIDGVLKRA